MLDSGGISRVCRDTDRWKILIAFYFLSTETEADGELFSFVSSERVDFKKRRRGIIVSQLFVTLAHLRSYKVGTTIGFDSNEQSCLDSIRLRYVTLRVEGLHRRPLMSYPAFLPPFILFNPPDCFQYDPSQFVCFCSYKNFS